MNFTRLLSLATILCGALLTTSAHATTFGPWQQVNWSAPAGTWGPFSTDTHPLDVCRAKMTNTGVVYDEVAPGVATGGADPRLYGGSAVVMLMQKTVAPYDYAYYYAQFVSNNKKVWTFDANPNVGQVYIGYGDYLWTGWYLVECTQFGG